MPNVTLQPAVPVELYEAADITPGTQISVLNNCCSTVKLSTTERGLESDYINLRGDRTADNDDGDLEAWVMAVNGGFINVTEA